MVRAMLGKWINKVVGIGVNVWTTPSRNREMQITQRDLAEWKRIEGIDQYHRKRS